jgi:hypothetical protein
MEHGKQEPVPVSDGAHWLTEERLRVYPRIFLAIFVIAAAGWVLNSHDLIDPQGKPLGYDFMAYWSASYLMLQGEPAAAYDVVRIIGAGRVGVPALISPHPWFYPPMFGLVVLPLALLPYIWSLALWLAATLPGFVLVLRRIAPTPHTVWLCLAFPGTYVNAIHGQNGFLVASLFGGAMLALERRPVLAGILIGLLSFKPHFGLLIPLALICGRQWTAFFAAAVTSIAFALASTAVLGVASWEAFFGFMPMVATLLEEPHNLNWANMPSMFASLRLLGVAIPVAYTLQALLALTAAAGVAWAWWRGTPLPLAAAVLISGSLLVSPYLFDYDMPLLAVVIALLAWDGQCNGWRRGEREILVAAWLIPVVGTVVSTVTALPLGILCLVAVFALALRRASLRQAHRQPGGLVVET